MEQLSLPRTGITSARGAARVAVAFVLGIGSVAVAFSSFGLLGGFSSFWGLLPFAALALYLLVVRFAAPLLWPGTRPLRATALVGTATLLLGVVAFFGVFASLWFTYRFNLCGADGSSTNRAGMIGLLAVYAVASTAAFLGPARRLVWLLPLALIAGWLVSAAITYAIPSNHGTFCES